MENNKERNANKELKARLADKEDELNRTKMILNDCGKIIHNMTVNEQAAWIEWQRGKGAEAAMSLIHNSLGAAGLIPDEDNDYAPVLVSCGKEAQAWFDANCDNIQEQDND